MLFVHFPHLTEIFDSLDMFQLKPTTVISLTDGLSMQKLFFFLQKNIYIYNYVKCR